MTINETLQSHDVSDVSSPASKASGEKAFVHRALFSGLQRLRNRRCLALLDPEAKTLLDLGAGNGSFVRLAKERGYDVTGTDKENDVATTRMQADIVTCFEVLEHLPDPVRAMQNLSQLYRRQLIVSVPNEPIFSLLRLGWESEHWWAVAPAALRHHLGRPAYEANIVFGRYHVAVWKKPS